MDLDDRTTKAVSGWTEPVYPPVETARPHNVQEILRQDAVPPAETLLHASDYDLGTDPLDAHRYYTKAFHDLEVSKMWSRTWQWAVWGHDIPRAGDIGVYRIVDRSVIIVRQPDLSLKAFVNSCLHRGRELCEADTRRNQLRCPYHGFTWGLDGDLKYIPAKWDFPQVDPAEFHLPEVRVDEWNGFIFVNFDKDAPSLKDYMGAMYDQWGGDNPQGAWNFKAKYKAVHLYREMNCNWKVGMEGFIEGFHVFASHPQMGAMVPESSIQYDVYPDEPHFSRFHSITGMPSSPPRASQPATAPASWTRWTACASTASSSTGARARCSPTRPSRSARCCTGVPCRTGHRLGGARDQTTQQREGGVADGTQDLGRHRRHVHRCRRRR